MLPIFNDMLIIRNYFIRKLYEEMKYNPDDNVYVLFSTLLRLLERRIKH